MATILEQKLRDKQKRKKEIDHRVSEAQLQPTKKERENIGEIINRISRNFRDELNDTNMDRSELNDRMQRAIELEIEKLDIPYERKARLTKLAVSNIIGLGPLQMYLDDPNVTEIIVQRYDNFCIERGGKIHEVNASFTDEEHLRNVINRILQPIGREVNMKTPIVDAHLADGSRVCATIPPVSPHGSTLTIRKFNNKMMTAEKYMEYKSLDQKCLDFLRTCVEGKISIFVSGGTGTGKTTFLNMLSSYLPSNEIIITIEDTLELQLNQKNVRSLETRQVNNENSMVVDMASLVKASLRMRPDRIIVGEVRDGAVVSLLSAMSTGHEGSMSTGHANSPANLVHVRIPTMMEMDKSSSFTERAQALMIAEALQLIIQLRRLPNGRRVISQITEVCGLDDRGMVKLKDIIRYNHTTDTFDYTGYYPEIIADKLDYYGKHLSAEMEQFKKEG